MSNGVGTYTKLSALRKGFGRPDKTHPGTRSTWTCRCPRLGHITVQWEAGSGEQGSTFSRWTVTQNRSSVTSSRRDAPIFSCPSDLLISSGCFARFACALLVDSSPSPRQNMYGMTDPMRAEVPFAFRRRATWTCGCWRQNSLRDSCLVAMNTGFG